jgi:hypothetical protein
MLTIVDHVTRKCLAIDVSRKLASEDALEQLSDLLVCTGAPNQIPSDNGLEFPATRGLLAPHLRRLPPCPGVAAATS